jgi:small conductance mechanosensitive channel
MNVADDISRLREVVTEIFYQYLGTTGTKLLDTAGNIIIALLILFIGFKLVGVIIKILDRMMEKSRVDATLITFMNSFLKVALKFLIIFWAISKAGIGASTIIALLGSAGVAVGLSLQGSLSNIAGGVILLLMKPFSVGDYILEDSSDKEGFVQAIGIMYTKLLTHEHKVVLIPNGNLSNSSITNYTAEGKRRIKISVGIEYDEDIRKVRKVLQEVVENEVSRLPDEPIDIFVDEFLDSSIGMGVHYWTLPGDYYASKWRTQEAVKMAFDENDITIPFGRLDVTIMGK